MDTAKPTAPSSPEARGDRRKSVRFSRFEKVFYTHSSGDYDRTCIQVDPPSGGRWSVEEVCAGPEDQSCPAGMLPSLTSVARHMGMPSVRFVEVA